MSHSKKSKAAGVSASSFLDLKSELAKQESEFAKNKVAGNSYFIGGVQRPDKKPTIWARSNKGIKSRMARDLQAEQLSNQTVESTREALERKAKIYDKLRKGKTGGLNEAQYGELLVDFDAKAAEDHWSSDSEDADESLTVPKPPEYDDDPLVEYEDEFGRVRTVRRSEVPREVLERKRQEEEAEEDDPFVVYNPTNHFPVYEPSAERLAAIREAASEAANPIEAHYDASREVRAKGAAFYSFSSDEQKRQQELEELRKARLDTEQARKETGAVDLKAGEVEGMIAGPSNVIASGSGGDGKVGVVKSRAVEKRKREIEERRRLLEEKRKKLRGGSELKAESDNASATPSSSSASTVQVATPATDTFAMLEGKPQLLTPTSTNATSQQPPDDPFAQVEARTTTALNGGANPYSKPVSPSTRKPKKRWDDGPKEKSLDSADAFLKELEKDLIGMR